MSEWNPSIAFAFGFGLGFGVMSVAIVMVGVAELARFIRNRIRTTQG